MGDEKDPDALFHQCPGDLPRNFRAFPLVGRSEGFVEQHHGIRRDAVCDGTHPRQFLVEFAALHGGVFFPLEVREQPATDARAEGSGRHEHTALHHQLSQADAAQENRLAALVGARDDHEGLPVGIHVVAHDASFQGQRQAGIVESPAGMPPLAGSLGNGKRQGLAQSGEPLLQVQAARVKSQFRAQPREETEDVIRGPGQRMGHVVDPPVSQFRQGPGAAFVTLVDRHGVLRGLPGKKPMQPALFVFVRLAQDVIRPLVAPVQPGADQHPPAEFQLFEVMPDAGEVVFPELIADHREKRPEPLRLERIPLCFLDRLEFPEHAYDHLHHLDGAIQDRAGIAAEEAPIILPFAFEGLHRKVIEAPDHGGVLQAILEDVLAVADGLRVVFRRGQNGLPGHVQQKGVAERHGLEQRVQFQILDQIRFAGRHVALQVEITVPVHEMRLHDRMRSFKPA
ncbi:MAG: hypothetical protein A4E73_00320 [Syntrophaceae bacterium PtaU1.Bin231]|nr:MAG: hypothetical protein A4E73_00320 [Syntrophaceae bacterium PtaU1.Bin231]